MKTRLIAATAAATAVATAVATATATATATAVAATSVLALAAASATAWAGPLRPGDIETKNRQTSKYTCATGKILQVTYWNAANGQSFALLPVKGKPLLFVSTLSASGVKYQAGSYTWWTKGTRADLYDAMEGGNARPILSDCVTLVR